MHLLRATHVIKHKRLLTIAAGVGLIACVIAISINVVSSHSSQRLEPCRGIQDDAYHKAVRSVIDRAAGVHAIVSIEVLPSFLPETGIRLTDGTVQYVEFESMLWSVLGIENADNWEEAQKLASRQKVRVHARPISPKLVQRLHAVATEQVQSIRPSNKLIKDSTPYYFAVDKAGCGMTKSPESNSNAGKLARISDLLARHAQLKTTEELSLSEIEISQAVTTLE